MNNSIIVKAAKQLNLPVKFVGEVYTAYWKYVRNYLSSLNLKDDITEEEFSKLQTSINVPSLGKFYIDWEYLQAKKEENERYKNKRNTAPVHNSDNDT